MEGNDLIIYKNSDGNIIVDAIYKDETLWLTQKGMAKVFDCSTDNISLHLKNIFKENELDENSVVEDSSVTASDGKNYKTKILKLAINEFKKLGFKEIYGQSSAGNIASAKVIENNGGVLLEEFDGTRYYKIEIRK